jgi:hypothetical protein
VRLGGFEKLGGGQVEFVALEVFFIDLEIRQLGSHALTKLNCLDWHLVLLDLIVLKQSKGLSAWQDGFLSLRQQRLYLLHTNNPRL